MYKSETNKHMYSVFLKLDIHVILPQTGIGTLKESSCLGVQIFWIFMVILVSS